MAKIPVHHYIDATSLTMSEIIAFAGRKGYLKNLGGKTYIVEILA